MSFMKNGIMYDCDDKCDGCKRATFCEDYCPSDKSKIEEKQEETIVPEKKPVKTQPKEKYTQPNFLDLL